MVLTIKVYIKKVIALVLLLLVVMFVSYFLVFNVASSSSAYAKVDFTIVLDAGHGGMDGGVEGTQTGIKESELNLKIVKKLEKFLTSVGFNVVLTRKDENGLYNVFGRNYKLEDMEKRKDIILKSNANLVLSIHLNSFSNASLSGAQAYYDIASESSKLLADTIQKELVSQLNSSRTQSNFGDYYILKCTQNPSVMVECGFLTNKEEEALLLTEDYQQKIAYAIFCGVLKYFYEL